MAASKWLQTAGSLFIFLVSREMVIFPRVDGCNPARFFTRFLEGATWFRVPN